MRLGDLIQLPTQLPAATPLADQGGIQPAVVTGDAGAQPFSPQMLHLTGANAVNAAPHVDAAPIPGGLTAGQLAQADITGAAGRVAATDPQAMVKDAFSRLSGDDLSRWVQTNTGFRYANPVEGQRADGVARAVMKGDPQKLAQLDAGALDQAGTALTEGSLAASRDGKQWDWARRTADDRSGAEETHRSLVETQRAAETQRLQPQVEAENRAQAAAAEKFKAQMTAEASGPEPNNPDYARAKATLQGVLDGKPNATWETSARMNERLLNSFSLDGKEVGMTYNLNDQKMTFNSRELGWNYDLKPGTPGYAHLWTMGNQLFQRSQLPDGDPRRLHAEQELIMN